MIQYLRQMIPGRLFLVLTALLIARFPGPGSLQGASASELAWVTAEPKPHWIWRSDKTDNEPLFLRRRFEISGHPKSARIYCTCDNQATLWINGRQVGKVPDWGEPLVISDARSWLQGGINQIAVRAQNRGGAAAFIFKLEYEDAKGAKHEVITATAQPNASGGSWKGSLTESTGWQELAFNDLEWDLAMKDLGALGVGPWQVPGVSRAGGGGNRVDPNAITVPKGFRVERVLEVDKDTQGSWVSLTRDDQGRLYAGDQGNKGIFRITLGAKPGDAKVEKLPVSISGAQGLVWHQDQLYVHLNGGQLHRLSDSNGDGQLDRAEALPSERSGGEHGNHAVIVAEDGRQLYVVGGNHASLPPADSIVRRRVPTWDEDLLLPRVWDANGHARGRLAPGGWVSLFDPETRTHQIYSTGYRNEYDVALNRFGDLFTYDADMEWDMGAPWYRPTRINHVVSGSDYGWRSGSGKWPTYYEDSLPPVVEIGPGSPTGVVSGQGTHFPPRYQDAIFALDWTFGTIYAIHLTPDGAGYRGEQEAFCYGAPLPVTDAIVGRDGSLYFTVGGRGTPSSLFRITHVNGKGQEPPVDQAAAKARELRRSLETFHGRADGRALSAAWPHLGSPDRWLRHAARVAIESQPVDSWAQRVLAESDPQARITGAVALARMGGAKHRQPLLESLLQLDEKLLSEGQLLGLLRAYALNFIRLGAPETQERQRVISELDGLMPHSSPNVNTELVRLLVYLKHPGVISKAVKLIAERGKPELPDWSALAERNAGYGKRVLEMLKTPPPSREIGYAFMLRNLKSGWTLAERRVYFEFLNQAAKFPGGNSYAKFLTNMRDEAMGLLTNEERAQLVDVTGEDFNPVPDFEITPPKGPGREWTLQAALPHVSGGAFRKASFENGRNLFHAAACSACHRFDGLGGDIGPDLTTLQTKFEAGYILESILEPSRVISDQYGSKVVTLQNGEQLTGLVVERGDGVDVYPVARTSEELKPTRVPKGQVASIQESPVSQMPQGLLNGMNGDEIRDLVAYLMSGGDPESRRVYR